MNFENYEKFLESIDCDLSKIFEYQGEYLCCKEGCSRCCERGDYPLSRLEFEYLKYGFDKLEINIQNIILKSIELLKLAEKDSYACPFLIGGMCSVYKYRPFVCRAFGVLTVDANGNPTFPFCAMEGLNYSKIYDKEKDCLSLELVMKNGYKILPKFFNLSNKVMLQLPKTKELNLDFGETKSMIYFLLKDFKID